ncbi:hypothetical protein OG242_00830 [Streptomyces sp. NBC_00727]
MSPVIGISYAVAALALLLLVGRFRPAAPAPDAVIWPATGL